MNYDKLLKRLELEIRMEKPDDSEAFARLKEIAKVYSGDDQVVSSHDLIESVRENMGKDRILTGFKGLDSLLRGFRPKQLIVLSALTKSGKTTFCMDLTNRLRDYNPLWFSLEESAEELIEQYLERGQTPPFFATPRDVKDQTLEWFESKIIEGIAKYNSKIVFIDHLGRITKERSDTTAQEIEETMKELKQIARRWNIVIVLLCHVVKAEMDKQPTLNDLKGSSSIAQEADTVLFLWREAKRVSGEVVITNNVNLSIQAARRGTPGNIKLVFEDGHFIERDWTETEVDRTWNGF